MRELGGGEDAESRGAREGARGRAGRRGRWKGPEPAWKGRGALNPTEKPRGAEQELERSAGGARAGSGQGGEALKGRGRWERGNRPIPGPGLELRRRRFLKTRESKTCCEVSLQFHLSLPTLNSISFPSPSPKAVKFALPTQ